MINNIMNRVITSVLNRGGRIFEASVEVDGLSHDRIMTSVPEGIDPEQCIADRFGLQMAAQEPIDEPEG